MFILFVLYVLSIKAVIGWVLSQYVNMYHGFINLLRLWLPSDSLFWHYLPSVEEYVALNSLILLALFVSLLLLYWRNELLAQVNLGWEKISRLGHRPWVMGLISATKNAIATCRAFIRKYLR